MSYYYDFCKFCKFSGAHVFEYPCDACVVDPIFFKGNPLHFKPKEVSPVKVNVESGRKAVDVMDLKCKTCIHKDVCAYKDKYKEAHVKIDEAIESFDDISDGDPKKKRVLDHTFSTSLSAAFFWNKIECIINETGCITVKEVLDMVKERDDQINMSFGWKNVNDFQVIKVDDGKYQIEIQSDPKLLG